MGKTSDLTGDLSDLNSSVSVMNGGVRDKQSCCHCTLGTQLGILIKMLPLLPLLPELVVSSLHAISSSLCFSDAFDSSSLVIRKDTTKNNVCSTFSLINCWF